MDADALPLDFMLSDLALEAVVATGMWLLAQAFPFRRLEPRPEVAWDMLAVAFAFCFAFVAGSGLSWLFDTLTAVAAGWSSFVATWPVAAVAIGYVVFADFTSYWAHRLLHTRLLWHTHAFHHSSRHLYVLSGLRASFVHILLLFAGPIAGLSLFTIYEVPQVFAVIAASQVANQHYTHSNIRLPMSRYLEYLFVTPRYHFVHHSTNRRLSNSNYGFLFSIWDRMFGTFTDPESVRENDELGLDYENSRWRLLLGVAAR